MPISLSESLLPQPPSFQKKKAYEIHKVLGVGSFGKVMVCAAHLQRSALCSADGTCPIITLLVLIGIATLAIRTPYPSEYGYLDTALTASNMARTARPDERCPPRRGREPRRKHPSNQALPTDA